MALDLVDGLLLANELLLLLGVMPGLFLPLDCGAVARLPVALVVAVILRSDEGDNKEVLLTVRFVVVGILSALFPDWLGMVILVAGVQTRE